MRFLADAHISRLIHRFVEAAGHDCIHAESILPGLSDADLLRIAVQDQRIILTTDKDFGELVFRRRVPAMGIVLLRLRAPSEAERLSLLEQHWAAIEKCALDHFVVVSNRQVRRSPLPSE